MSSTKLRVKELLRARRWTTKVLSEKTGMSESYLTHIKNGTRRWNEDALKKIADAFELKPIELFAYRDQRTDNIDNLISQINSENGDKGGNLKMNLVPVLGAIPSDPSPYNNQQIQNETGHVSEFVPVVDFDSENMFCYQVQESDMTPRFAKSDYLIIAPEIWTKSGDIVAVEYTHEEKTFKGIRMVSYMEDFVVFESVNHQSPPVAMLRGKDNFKIIGKVIWKYRKL